MNKLKNTGLAVILALGIAGCSGNSTQIQNLVGKSVDPKNARPLSEMHSYGQIEGLNGRRVLPNYTPMRDFNLICENPKEILNRFQSDLGTYSKAEQDLVVLAYQKSVQDFRRRHAVFGVTDPVTKIVYYVDAMLPTIEDPLRDSLSGVRVHKIFPDGKTIHGDDEMLVGKARQHLGYHGLEYTMDQKQFEETASEIVRLSKR